MSETVAFTHPWDEVIGSHSIVWLVSTILFIALQARLRLGDSKFKG